MKKRFAHLNELTSILLSILVWGLAGAFCFFIFDAKGTLQAVLGLITGCVCLYLQFWLGKNTGAGDCLFSDTLRGTRGFAVGKGAVLSAISSLPILVIITLAMAIPSNVLKTVAAYYFAPFSLFFGGVGAVDLTETAGKIYAVFLPIYLSAVVLSAACFSVGYALGGLKKRKQRKPQVVKKNDWQ